MPKTNAVPRKAPTAPATLAVVDLGSNSFRLEVGRVEGDQIFRLDTWRETIRLGCPRGRDQHVPGCHERGDIPATGGGRARLSD